MDPTLHILRCGQSLLLADVPPCLATLSTVEHRWVGGKVARIKVPLVFRSKCGFVLTLWRIRDRKPPRPIHDVLVNGDPDPEKPGVAYVGMLPLIRAVLIRNGYRVQVMNADLPPLPRPTSRPTAVEFVHRHERGLMLLGEMPAVKVVAQIAGAWPDAKMVVVVGSRHARQFRRQLERLTGEDVDCFASNYLPTRAGRIVVASAICLGEGALEMNYRDIVIWLEPQRIPHSEYDYRLFGFCAAERARCYGILSADKKLAPYLRDHLIPLFGPETLHLPGPDRVLRRVRTATCPLRAAVDPETLTTSYAALQALFGHPVRNRLVARLARAVAEKDDRRLARFLPGWTGSIKVRKDGVVLLAGSVDHALKLGRLLPDWPIITGRYLIQDGLGNADRARLADVPRRLLGRPVIATPAGVERVPCSVLVRADAGTGLPPLSAGGLECAAGEDRPLLIVDVEDRSHPLLRRRTRKRQAAYRAAGWYPAGTPIPDVLDRFLTRNRR